MEKRYGPFSSRTCRQALWLAAVAGCFFSPLSHAEEPVVSGASKRLLNGEEIYLHFKFDQWRIRGQSNLGFRFDVQALPNGVLYGSNLSGGGALTGRWEVNPREDVLCLKWERGAGLPAGCYLMSQIGSVSFQLDDLSTGETVWQFVVVNQP